ncbi:MAG: DUF5060 domain-containing protein [Kiritimatiellaeota bacterium]|nr:DUF5060 domain-containing protein [Kiritimatiellota bacterium]
MKRFAWMLMCCAVAGNMKVAAEVVPLAVVPAAGAEAVALPYEAQAAFPGELSFGLAAPQPQAWLDSAAVRVTVVLPEGIPAHTGSLVWLKDRDHYWHQHVMQGFLKPGTNTVTVPFHSGASGWSVPGYSVAWHHRTRLNPQSVGFRVFANGAFTGACTVVSAELEVAKDAAPPVISKVTPLTKSPAALRLYELKFSLPDRYANPFDPAQIDAGAFVRQPDGTTNTVTAFYYQPHYRIEDELGQPVEPEGLPEWRIRYCPRQPGEHVVSLFARDAAGEAIVAEEVRFTARPASPDALRFVRVSEKDRRYFELDDGAFFYPIGHNLRSATDARMDDKFPWRFRKEEGSTAYRRYFQRMQHAGENMAEVWMSAWSLGLEWTEGVSGYHGANDYHLGNAWELDRVLNLALEHRIYVNLVLNYHGRISSWCDPEWHIHPYNKLTPGGWLTWPLEFFADPRAIEMQKRFCRYTQARWGWHPNVFGYELCSEINLTGHEGHHRTHDDPRVVEWCRALGTYFKQIDPYGHLVSAHVSNDYRYWNPVLCLTPELTHNPLDAYNNANPNVPEHIITLLIGTVDRSAAESYNKPALITEFGGSAMATGLENLKIEHHAAIWAGACLPLGGIPMFWWWQVVDENDLYGRYTAVKKFMDGQDLRDPAAKLMPATLSGDNAAVVALFSVLCTASPERARGYIYPKRFAREGQPAPQGDALTVVLAGFGAGVFRVEFFETEHGKVLRRFDARTTPEGNLVLAVPSFNSDCAFRLTRLNAAAK